MINGSYDHYKIFYLVALCGSFNGASGIAQCSRSSAVRAVNALEKSLGCQLVARTRTGIVLTKEGEILYKHVRMAVLGLERAETRMRRRQWSGDRKLQIAVDSNAYELLLESRLSEFKKTHQNVALQVNTCSSEDAAKWVLYGGMDVALVTGSDRSKYRAPLVCRSVAGVTFLPVFAGSDSEGFAGSDSEKLNGSDSECSCCDMPVITTENNMELTRTVYGENGGEFRPDMVVQTNRQVAELIKSGIGRGLVPDFWLTDDMKIDDIPGDSAKMTVYALYCNQFSLPDYVREFLDMLP